MPSTYRDKIFIRKDIILLLGEHGPLNQTKLLTFCSLNLVKHKEILDGLVKNNIIEKTIRYRGKTAITYYNVTDKGLEFSKQILEPYEKMFPRSDKS